MRKRIVMLILFLTVIGLSACNQDKNNDNNDVNLDDLLTDLTVEFDLPENIEVGETLKLEAIVTYGDDLVTDASEVNFEYWVEGKKDDSITIDSENNKDGSYTAEVTFDEDAVILIQAHTTAEGLHTMPKRTVIVGDAISTEDGDGTEEHVKGFNMHFTDPGDLTVGNEVMLTVKIKMDDKPFENAEVRYEIWNNNEADNRVWLDVAEEVPGEYQENHTFSKAGSYSIQVHVEDNNDLHEHETYEVKVIK